MPKTHLNPPKACDLCKGEITNAFVDGKTVYAGSWANMCPKCHHKYGIGLGAGKGQRYEKVAEHFAKVEG